MRAVSPRYCDAAGPEQHGLEAARSIRRLRSIGPFRVPGHFSRHPTRGIIDVVVPCRRCTRYLLDCASSILNQSLRDVRVRIMVDASPDDTASVAHRFAGSAPQSSWSRMPRTSATLRPTTRASPARRRLTSSGFAPITSSPQGARAGGLGHVGPSQGGAHLRQLRRLCAGRGAGLRARGESGELADPMRARARARDVPRRQHCGRGRPQSSRQGRQGTRSRAPLMLVGGLRYAAVAENPANLFHLLRCHRREQR